MCGVGSVGVCVCVGVGVCPNEGGSRSCVGLGVWECVCV